MFRFAQLDIVRTYLMMNIRTYPMKSFSSFCHSEPQRRISVRFEGRGKKGLGKCRDVKKGLTFVFPFFTFTVLFI